MKVARHGPSPLHCIRISEYGDNQLGLLKFLTRKIRVNRTILVPVPAGVCVKFNLYDLCHVNSVETRRHGGSQSQPARRHRSGRAAARTHTPRAALSPHRRKHSPSLVRVGGQPRRRYNRAGDS